MVNHTAKDAYVGYLHRHWRMPFLPCQPLKCATPFDLKRNPLVLAPWPHIQSIPPLQPTTTASKPASTRRSPPRCSRVGCVRARSWSSAISRPRSVAPAARCARCSPVGFRRKAGAGNESRRVRAVAVGRGRAAGLSRAADRRSGHRHRVMRHVERAGQTPSEGRMSQAKRRL